MKLYQKPIITIDSGLCEGIYAASGNNTADNGPKCDSKYMNGT